MRVYPELAACVAQIQAEVQLIDAGRRVELERLARLISECRRGGKITKLIFVCTHNSRRSHLAQIWSWIAAQIYGVDRIETYSGGTEATAFNPRAVAALIRAGFRIETTSTDENPVYSVRHGEGCNPLECFSKVYDQPPNPKEGFCAIMTCSAADKACPLVIGASERLTIRYDDPKAFDGFENEAAMYDERCRQIAREMLFVMRKANLDRGTLKA